MRRILVMILCFILFLTVMIAIYINLPMFGALPTGDRLEKIQKSVNYKDGKFRNQRDVFVRFGNPVKALMSILFDRMDLLRPKISLPSIKTNLKKIDIDKEIIVWFGHSSYFIQLNGKRILVDPLFSKVSSPVLFFPKAFAGSDIYKPEDMPLIDYLIITHDHWDHLDYKTIKDLKLKVKKVICPLGVGAHLQYWGFNDDQIVEMDWMEEYSSREMYIHCLPAQHFSGRGFRRNKSLWASFLIKSKDFQIYLGGDGGYGPHFKDIGEKFGAIDLAILDSGQHNKNWSHIHMMTDEVVKASKDLNAKILLPGHICKLSLANHPWKEPLEELSSMMKQESFKMITPMIGEIIYLKSPSYKNPLWWVNIE